jgi:glycosyltransferase involved in cell wall biosynthesis
VEDGVNGLLVPAQREDLLAAAVDRLIAQEGLRAALIEGARRTLRGRFQWETMVAETGAVLKDAVLPKGENR